MCNCIKWDLEFEENITPIRFRTTALTDVYEQMGDINLAQKETGHTTPRNDPEILRRQGTQDLRRCGNRNRACVYCQLIAS